MYCFSQERAELIRRKEDLEKAEHEEIMENFVKAAARKAQEDIKKKELKSQMEELEKAEIVKSEKDLKKFELEKEMRNLEMEENERIREDLRISKGISEKVIFILLLFVGYIFWLKKISNY